MCEYCSDWEVNHKTLDSVHERALDVEIYGRYLCLIDMSEDGCPVIVGKKKIDYCPMCGRKLTKVGHG